MSVIISNTALIYTISGQSGLVNIKTNEIIGKLDKYYTIYSNDEKIFVQEKERQDTNIRTKHKDIRIYDAEKEEMIIEDCKMLDKFDDNVWLYLNKNNNKINLFDFKYYRENSNSINENYDDVKKLCSTWRKNYLLVTINGKKGIYQIGKGLIIPCEYDDIQINEKIVIFTKNNKQQFTNINKFPLLSLEFDSIKNDNKFVYCKDMKRIFVYDDDELIMDFTCDELNFIRTINDIYFYIYKENNKYGIVVASKITKKASQNNKVLIDNNYDEIIHKGYGVFYIKKDNKIGLYEAYENVFIEPKYNKIEETEYDNVYQVYNGEFCDLVYISNKKTSTLVQNCKIIKDESSGIIYSKNNYCGLLVLNNETPEIIENYDKFEHLGNGFFMIEKGSNKGIYNKGKIIIPVKYKDIKHTCDKICRIGAPVYFVLKNDNKCYELAKTEYWYSSKSDIVYNNYYNEIQLLPDIMVFKDNTCTYIYNYDQQPLSVMHGDRQISIIEIPDGKLDTKILYIIDDVYYFYKNGRFEMAPVEECDLYQTIYESKNGDVVVSSFNKKEHDYVCEKIELGGEINIDKTIENIYKENSKLKGNYPVLVKRLEPKKNMD